MLIVCREEVPFDFDAAHWLLTYPYVNSMHNTKSPIPKKRRHTKKAKANAFAACGVITLNKAANKKKEARCDVLPRNEANETHLPILMADTNMQKGAQTHIRHTNAGSWLSFRTPNLNHASERNGHTSFCIYICNEWAHKHMKTPTKWARTHTQWIGCVYVSVNACCSFCKNGRSATTEW